MFDSLLLCAPYLIACVSSHFDWRFFALLRSHEIRTPMNAVIGIGRLLADTQLTLEQQQYTQMINNSGHLLLTIINVRASAHITPIDRCSGARWLRCMLHVISRRRRFCPLYRSCPLSPFAGHPGLLQD
jgi:hypothetical protein